MPDQAYDYADALSGIDQALLDSAADLTEIRKMGPAAYLKIGAMHGVTVQMEAPLDEKGDVPEMVRSGLVVRCLIPKEINLEVLRDSMAGGEIGRLIGTILNGHELVLEPQAASGRLNRSAERARNKLLQALDTLSKATPPQPWATAYASLTSAPASSLYH